MKSVPLDAGFDPKNPVDETRWVQSIADRHGFPHGIVAFAELNDPDVERVLAAHARFPNTRGIRQSVNWHADPIKTFVSHPTLLTDNGWLEGFSLLRKYGLSFDLQLYPSQMLDAARLAANHPDTLIIVNHTGMPVDKDEAGLAAWRTGMRALAANDNVRVKVSGLGMLDWHWTESSIRPFVLETIGIFGTDRSMFASNFPVDKLYSDFNTLYGAFKSIVTDFSLDEKHKLFYSVAEETYRL